MPKRESSWHRPTCPSPSEFHCGSTSTARRGPPGPTPRAGKNRVTTRSFSRCGVGRAVGNVTREVPSPSLATVYSSLGAGVSQVSESARTEATYSRTTFSSSPGGAVRPPGGIQSRPHSNGRTTRSLETLARWRSQAWKNSDSTRRLLVRPGAGLHVEHLHEERVDVRALLDDLRRRLAGAVARLGFDPDEHGRWSGLRGLQRRGELETVRRRHAIVVIGRCDERRRIGRPRPDVVQRRVRE